MKKELWKPQIGDHVFSVCEFLLDDYDYKKLPPGYDRHGYEIVESVVKGEYIWKSFGKGCKSVSRNRPLGNNINNCFFWRPADYGKKVFQTFDEAIPLAEEMTKQLEGKLAMYKKDAKPFRHWLKKEHKQIEEG